MPPHRNQPVDEPAPWTCEGVAHRVSNLEQIVMRHEGHFRNLEIIMSDNKTEVHALTKTLEEVGRTLISVQQTLLLMNEMLATYNDTKTVFSWAGKAVDFVIKASKVVAAGSLLAAVIYGATHLKDLT